MKIVIVDEWNENIESQSMSCLQTVGYKQLHKFSQILHLLENFGNALELDLKQAALVSITNCNENSMRNLFNFFPSIPSNPCSFVRFIHRMFQLK